ncbi:MFS transporter [Paraburkholderia phymatum]|nr:MFS transporter [Paraburkholderia phymatum]
MREIKRTIQNTSGVSRYLVNDSVDIETIFHNKFLYFLLISRLYFNYRIKMVTIYQEANSQAIRADEFDLSKSSSTRITITCFVAWVLSVYDFTLFGTLLPEISKSFNWSVSRSTEVATWVTVGTFIVSVGLGPFLDRYGRRTMLIVTVLGAAFSSGATGLAMGAVSVVLIRAFSGFGYSEEVVNSMYINEVYRNSSRRGLVYGFVQGGWPVGALIAAGLTAILLPIVGWRWCFVIAMVPSVCVAVSARKLPESPVFLALRASEQNAASRPKASLRDLFTPGIRLHSVCTLLVWFCNWMTVQVLLVLGTTVLTVGKGVSFENSLIVLVSGNAIGYLGFIVHGWLGDRIGRRLTVIVGWSCAFVVTACMLLGPKHATFVYAMYALSLFFVSGPVAALMFYFGESYPPQIRGMGMNFAHIMGPVGAIAGAGLLSVLLSSGMPMIHAAFITGSLPMLCAVLLMFGTRKIDQSIGS